MNDVFKLASELITLTDEIDPMSATLYELVLKRRTELLKRPQHWPCTDSWFPLRVPSLQCRANAVSAKHIPTQLARSQSSGAYWYSSKEVSDHALRTWLAQSGEHV